MPLHRLLLAAAAALLPFSAAADGTLSATSSGQGLGLEVAGVDRSFEISGSEFQANGTLGGLHAYYQRGAGFRAEARLLAGGLDYEFGTTDEGESITLANLQVTAGRALADDTRVYGGLGAEYLFGDSPFGGDLSTWTVYVPVGVSRSADFSEGWRVLVSVEGRFLLVGRDEVDDIPSAGDAEFDRTGGLGLEVSAQFHNAEAGISVEPYLQVMAPSDTERENVGGTDVRLEDASNVAGGVRASWTF